MLSIKHYTIPVFVPELACPFQCVFCNQRKISGHSSIPGNTEIIQIIENHLSSFKHVNRRVEVGFFGGSFTGIDPEEQKRYLSLVQPYIKSGDIKSIRLSTRPDYINNDILFLLKEMNVGTIELGAQSMDDEVLKLSKRGHNSQQIKDASQLIIDNGFKLGLQMMIGLPGDSFERSLNTANEIVKYGADNTRIYPALVIKNTLMHKWYNEGKYIPLTLEEAVEWAGHILQIFEKNNVNVIRVGLHPSEGLLSGDEIIAGPFHQSFRELVLTNIWGGILNKIKQPHDKTKTIDIFVNKRELNYAIGHKQVNRKRLLKEFKNVFFKADNSIKLREAKIRVL